MNKKNAKKPVVIAKGTKLPRKSAEKSKKDFFFITSVSVFAAMTIFAAEMMIQDKEPVKQTQKNDVFVIAPLDITAKPTPTPTPRPTPTPLPTPQANPYSTEPLVD